MGYGYEKKGLHVAAPFSACMPRQDKTNWHDAGCITDKVL